MPEMRRQDPAYHRRAEVDVLLPAMPEEKPKRQPGMRDRDSRGLKKDF